MGHVRPHRMAMAMNVALIALAVRHAEGNVLQPIVMLTPKRSDMA